MERKSNSATTPTVFMSWLGNRKKTTEGINRPTGTSENEDHKSYRTMKTRIRDFIKRHFGPLLLFGGLGAYVIASEVTGSCPACSAITSAIGLPSLISSANAAETPAASKAPAWELKDVDGRPVKSSDFDGKVVILDFWATWCPPCKAEIPGFVELQKQYGEKGLVVIGVSLDEQGPGVVKPFMKQFGVNYPVVMGDAKIVQDFGGIKVIPTTFVIDRSGNIVARHIGYMPKETFAKEITPLL
jgi:thiol-disulfide isomerase/thioredoxin